MSAEDIKRITENHIRFNDADNRNNINHSLIRLLMLLVVSLVVITVAKMFYCGCG